MSTNLFVLFCSKTDPDILPRIIGNLTLMLQDDSVQVAKKVILCMGQIYKIAFEVKLFVERLNVHVTFFRSWAFDRVLIHCY